MLYVVDDSELKPQRKQTPQQVINFTSSSSDDGFVTPHTKHPKHLTDLSVLSNIPSELMTYSLDKIFSLTTVPIGFSTKHSV